jgi:hypothetical protein
MIEDFKIEEQVSRELFQLEFDRIAKQILSEYLLVTPQHSYQIREIEFYYFSENHQDWYCHKNPRQLTNSKFYFHRFLSPEKYLNLKQKGFDLTIGNSDNRYGGILIRAIQNSKSQEVLTGIGLITNRIIEEMDGPDKISTLYVSNVSIFEPNSSLRIQKCETNNLKIFKKQRQGLNLKTEDSDSFFLTAPYNYFTYPKIHQVI